MAVDKSSVSVFPHIFEQATVADTWVEIDLPSQCTEIVIYSDNHPALIGVNDCTDGGAAAAASSYKVEKDEHFRFRIGKGNSRPASVFFTTVSTGDSIKIMLLE